MQDANTAAAGVSNDLGASGFPGGDAAAAANVLQGGLGAARMVSGMSIEGFMTSRNLSGLDTMQSIEHALPNSEGQQVA